MKKIFSILLVTALAASTVFAAFSGSATVGLGANFDNGEYGFIGNGTNVNFNIDVASASAEAISEGDVYASIKASLGLVLKSDEDGIAAGDPLFAINLTNPKKGDIAAWLYAKIDEAKVAGANWYVSLLGVASVNDFAKSAIDTWTVENEIDSDYGFRKADYDKNATYKVGYQKAPGVEVGVYDYVIGLGFKAEAVKTPEFDPFNKYAATAYVKTPEYAIVDGLTIQAGATYAISDGSYKDEVNAVGASAKVAYADDMISASVATDLGYDINAEKFGADVAAAFKYDFVSVDAYYATAAANSGSVDKVTGKYTDGAAVENLLSAKVATDLNSFEVPVKLTVTGKDLINKQDLGLKAEVAIAEVTLTPSVGYVIKSETFKAGLDVAYTTDAFTAKAGVSTETAKFNADNLLLGASASVESAALIPGATLKLAWSDAKDLLDNNVDKTNYGKIVASCKIAF